MADINLLPVLRVGSQGEVVKMWQSFLRGAGFDISIDGDYGNKTKAITISFQNRSGIGNDGAVGNETWGAALSAGINCVHDDHEEEYGTNWPPKPDELPYLNTAARHDLFGDFTVKPAPSFNNPEGLVIEGDWAMKNIVKVTTLQLKKVSGAPRSGGIWLHKAIEDQFKGMWAKWEDQDLTPLVKTWGGSYVARYIRGSKTSISNHAFGTAFDINAQWNRLGRQPALVGKEGSVRKLVEIAYEFGFGWGGWYRSRADGMHFEAFKIL